MGPERRGVAAGAPSDQGPLPRISDGVFFTAPAALPRGKHALSKDEVVAAQRERMMIAVTELLSARGPREVGPKDVCTRAGLSLSAFYACFESKDACVFAAYDRFIAVLLGRLVGIGGEDLSWRPYVEALIGAYVGTLASDLVVARAFQVEMDAMGSPARQRRRDALSAMAALLREKHTTWDPTAHERLPPDAYLAGVYGLRQLVSDALEREAEPELVELGRRAAVWVAELFG